MNGISGNLPNLACQWPSATAGTCWHISRTTRMMATTTQSKEITILTEQGDRVTISTAQHTQSSLLDYAGMAKAFATAHHNDDQLAESQTGWKKETRFGFKQSRHLSITVDGELNAREKREIRKIVGRLERLTWDFLNGVQDPQRLAKAFDTQKLQTISGISASFRQSRAVSVYQQETVAYRQQGIAGDQASQSSVADELNALNGLIKEMAQAVRQSPVDPRRAFNPIKQMFRALRNDLAAGAPENGIAPRAAVAKILQTELLERIRQLDARPAKAPFRLGPLTQPDKS